MSPSKSDIPIEEMYNAQAVMAYSSGGTLSEFFDYWKRNGHQCAISENRTQIWFPNSSRELMRMPMNCRQPVEPAVLREILSQKSVWAVTYLIECDEKHHANSFYYVCRNPNYHISSLPRKMRRNIRGGFRHFDIRLCTWDELADNGFAAIADTDARHGRNTSSMDGFQNMVKRHRQTNFFEVWGAWYDGKLAAWATIFKVDNWVCWEKTCSCTDTLKLVPNNAIWYAITQRSLVEEKRDWISPGVSSIYDSMQFGLHNFKIRMGYEAIPVHRAFALHPVVKHMATSTMVSWMLEKVSRARPQSAILQKANGMLRILSGREKNAIAWAEDKP